MGARNFNFAPAFCVFGIQFFDKKKIFRQAEIYGGITRGPPVITSLMSITVGTRKLLAY